MNILIIIFFIVFILLLAFPFFYQSVFSKYIFDYSFVSTKILIDKKPEIEVLSVSNTNTGYEKYANKTHEITLKVKVKEKNITINHFNRDTINVLINDEMMQPFMEINEFSNHNGEIIYHILL